MPRTINEPCVYGGAKKARPLTRARPAAPQSQPQPQHWIGDPVQLCPDLDEKAAGALKEALYAHLTKGKKPAPKGTPPHFVISIGPPGAGKSTVTRRLVETRSGIAAEDYVAFDFDTLLDFVPEAAKLHAIPDVKGRPTDVGYAYGWANCLDRSLLTYGVDVVTRLLNERYNLLLQSHYFLWLVDAQERGYACTLLYVAVAEEVATARAAKRAMALGRFRPPATPDTGWGWAPLVKEMAANYRLMAPWYALWADNFVTVNNDREGVEPGADDFHAYVTHPPLPPEQDWHGVLAGLHAAIEAAHEEGAPAPRRDKK